VWSSQIASSSDGRAGADSTSVAGRVTMLLLLLLLLLLK